LDIEPLGAYRVRIRKSCARGGLHTTNAIRSAIIGLDGVLDCDVFENTSSAEDADGIPAHAIRVVVWDGSPAAASDDEIAQAIWDHAATFSMGSESGVATDPNLGEVVVLFERATVQDIEVSITISSESGVAAEDIEDALIAGMPDAVGKGVVLNKLAATCFNVPGVDDFDEDTFAIDGAQDDLPAVQLVIYRLVAADITVLGDVT
jgi:hypothetical protein